MILICILLPTFVMWELRRAPCPGRQWPQSWNQTARQRQRCQSICSRRVGRDWRPTGGKTCRWAWPSSPGSSTSAFPTQISWWPVNGEVSLSLARKEMVCCVPYFSTLPEYLWDRLDLRTVCVESTELESRGSRVYIASRGSDGHPGGVDPVQVGPNPVDHNPEHD